MKRSLSTTIILRKCAGWLREHSERSGNARICRLGRNTLWRKYLWDLRQIRRPTRQRSLCWYFFFDSDKTQGSPTSGRHQNENLWNSCDQKPCFDWSHFVWVGRKNPVRWDQWERYIWKIGLNYFERCEPRSSLTALDRDLSSGR